jgi:hypothetical protein
MTPTLDEIQQDGLALGIARATALANSAAVAHGKDPSQSLVTISEETPPPDRRWRVHYGPRDFRGRRGGDLMVIVNERLGVVERVLRGQ